MPSKADLGVRKSAFLHDLRGSKFSAPVYEGDRVRELGQEDRLFQGRVTTADHGDVLAAEKEAVTGSTCRYAIPEQLSFSRQAEHQGASAHCHYHGLRLNLHLIASRRVAVPDRMRPPVGELGTGDLRREQLSSKALGLGTHLAHEQRAEDPFGKARIVLDFRGQHQLPARLVTSRGQFAFQHQRFEIGARRVERCRQPCGARTNDHHLPEFGSQFAHTFHDQAKPIDAGWYSGPGRRYPLGLAGARRHLRPAQGPGPENPTSSPCLCAASLGEPRPRRTGGRPGPHNRATLSGLPGSRAHRRPTSARGR